MHPLILDCPTPMISQETTVEWTRKIVTQITYHLDVTQKATTIDSSLSTRIAFSELIFGM